MSLYNFKKIAVVPTAKDFIDIILSKTQRKTPTVVHKHYKISRIRAFYMRKVKFTQQNFHDRLSRIIQCGQGLRASSEVRRLAVQMQAAEESGPRSHGHYHEATGRQPHVFGTGPPALGSSAVHRSLYSHDHHLRVPQRWKVQFYQQGDRHAGYPGPPAGGAQRYRNASSDRFGPSPRRHTVLRRPVRAISLFESIKPLFSNKPLIVVLNKMDVVTPEDLPPNKKQIVDQLLETCAKGNLVNADPNSDLSVVPVMHLQKNYSEIPEEERHDPIPEFWEGHNIADYIDPDIFDKLAELEREEELRIEGGMYAVPKIELDDTMKEIRELARQIRNKKAILKDESRLVKQSTKPVMPRTSRARARDRSTGKLREEMEKLGVDMSDTKDAHFTRSRSRSQSAPAAKRARADSRGRSVSRPARDTTGVGDALMQQKAKKLAHVAIAKKTKRMGLKGEADRFIGTKMPKHLFAGKRGVGKTDRR
ncbi:hypothetical protein HF086_012355 [Spodoptera exigua]|uniref:Nucleolar GTP-binding protein 1 n=1 Tax=Spodoptera exigua TaxID=7107 RepID=A0A922M9Q3_SPOEX|nr:hypothetical protein HF086_012355 [Spodoptera exigua]